jgi:hypothetical protein
LPNFPDRVGREVGEPDTALAASYRRHCTTRHRGVSHRERIATMSEQQSAEQTEDFASETDMVDTGQTKPEQPKKKDEPGKNEPKRIVARILIDAGAELARTWDAKGTGVSKKDAAVLIGNFLSYCPGDHWARPLVLPDTNRASKHKL